MPTAIHESRRAAAQDRQRADSREAVFPGNLSALFLGVGATVPLLEVR